MMKFLNKFNQTFGFTQTESRVVIFLVAAFLAGSVVKLYKDSSYHRKEFSYAAADSEFAARSRPHVESDSSVVGGNEQHGGNNFPPVTHDVSGSQRININSAAKEELVRLPGVGEAIAERIVLYRKEHGAFRSVNELVNVKGIGKKKLDRILPFCILGK